MQTKPPHQDQQLPSHKANNELMSTIEQEVDLVGVLPRVIHTPSTLSPRDMYLLQRTIGNQAVGRLAKQNNSALSPTVLNLLQMSPLSLEILKARHQGEGIQILSESPQQTSAQGVIVHGATEGELLSISATLSLLPVSNYSAIPRIVVAEKLNGGKTTGGGSISESRVRELMESPTWRRLAEEARWIQLPRIELTRNSFKQAKRRARGRDAGSRRRHEQPIQGTTPGAIWDSLIHETGHFIQSTYDIDELVRLSNFPHICYGGTNRSSECGGAGERFADAYMKHFTSPSSEGDPESSTIRSVLSNVEAQYQSRRARR